MTIGSVYAIAGGLCAAAAWLWRTSRRYQRIRLLRVPCMQGERNAHESSPSMTLILEMIAVAIRQGASIPRALLSIGELLDDSQGQYLRHVGKSLNSGYTWHDAWMDFSDDGTLQEEMRVVCDALEDSWLSGSSPLGRLQSASDGVAAFERSQIEQGASRLSVKLLIPTGLCFLPAFICIGVIPSIASFMS